MIDLEKLFKFVMNGNIYVAIDQGIDHPCACLWASVQPDNRIFFYREYQKSGNAVPDNAVNIKNMMLPDEQVFMWLIDPATRERDVVQKESPTIMSIWQTELSKAIGYEIALLPANNNREYGFEEMKRCMLFDEFGRTRFNIIAGTCPKLVEQLMVYNAAVKKHDDLVDCCRYLIAQNPKYIDVVEMQKFYRRRERADERSSLTGY